MPELGELRKMEAFINKYAKDRKFARVSFSEVTKQGPRFSIPNGCEISALARGKELRLEFKSPTDTILFVTFGMGMSGDWKFIPTGKTLPKHSHVMFHVSTTDGILVMVDPRRFGRWQERDFEPQRGGDPVSEYAIFCKKIANSLDQPSFQKPICLVLLDQDFFNGIGNFLRAEILHRAGVKPFEVASEALGRCNPATGDWEQNRLLQLCKQIPEEQMRLDGFWDDGHTLQLSASFHSWLQVYCAEGAESLRDSSGRTIWFRGASGLNKTAPTILKAKKVTSRNLKRREYKEDEDHDYDDERDASRAPPKKKKPKEEYPMPIKPRRRRPQLMSTPRLA